MRVAVGEILAELGGVTLSTLRSASDWQRAHGGTIERALLETGAITEDALTAALSKASGLPAVSREVIVSAPPDIVSVLPAETRRRLRAIPFGRTGSALRIAVARPSNPVLETGLIASTGSEVVLSVLCEPVLEDCLDHWDQILEGAVTADEEHVPVDPKSHDPFEKLARALFSEAIDQEATDLELGTDPKGGWAITSRAGQPGVKRRLPGSVMPQLFSWLEVRRGFLTIDTTDLDDVPRRYDVEMARTMSGGLKLKFVQLPDAAASEPTPIAVPVLKPKPPVETQALAPPPRPAPRPVAQPAPAPVRWRCHHAEARAGDVFCPTCGDLV